MCECVLVCVWLCGCECVLLCVCVCVQSCIFLTVLALVFIEEGGKVNVFHLYCDEKQAHDNAQD